MNKVLVTVEVPILELSYEFYIPINKKVGYVKKKVLELIGDKLGDRLVFDRLSLYDKETGMIYLDNYYVINTNIRNGSILVLF